MAVDFARSGSEGLQGSGNTAQSTVCIATDLTELRGAWTSVFLQYEANMLDCTIHVTLYKGTPGWFSIAEIVSDR